MKESYGFNVLDSVDSSNNYAMAKLHEGMASHGMAYFTKQQMAGKGQRGKAWKSEQGKNILLSLVIKPRLIFRMKPFYLSAFIAVCCNDFLRKITGEDFLIKWPNDLYLGDRKAGGILIENTFSGTEWTWAICGIGINVNQTQFGAGAENAISLAQISKQQHDPIELARQLHQAILTGYDAATETSLQSLMQEYNDVLYKKDEEVKLRRNYAMFQTRVIGVNDSGQLITQDVIERQFNFGAVEWIRNDS